MKLPEGLTRTVGRQILLAKKNSPHIFFVGGVVGVAASAVLACRATLKLEQTLDEVKDRVDQAKYSKDIPNSERQRVVAVVYVKGALKVGRLYGPSAVLGAASVVALSGSHVQLTRRNAALTSTLAVVSQAYNDYRERIRQEFGEERELDIYRGIQSSVVEVDGKKKTLATIDPNRHSPYARCFDASTENFEKNAELNRIFIQCQEKYFNDILQVRGHVFLNEVYERLGFEHTPHGAVMGWIKRRENDPDADGRIDFAIFQPDNARFVNGYEHAVWLDFNVDERPIYLDI